MLNCSHMYRFVLILLLICGFARPVSAFWIWTPETNKWVNPKYAVKETPQEQFTYAKEFLDAKEYEKAIEEFKKLIKHYPRAREAAEAQFHLGMILEERGELFEAFKNYQMVIDKYPFSERAAEVIKREYQIGNKMLEGKEERSKIMNVIIGGDYNVVEVFRTVIKNAPYGEFAAPSQYKIGLYLQGKQLYQESRDELEKVINDYPDSEWATAAKYQIALSDSKRSAGPQYDQAITQTAVEEFKRFVQAHPDAELSDKAQEHIRALREKEAENTFLVAQFYEKQKKFKSAQIYYSTIVEEYATTTWASKALEKMRELSSKIQ